MKKKVYINLLYPNLNKNKPKSKMKRSVFVSKRNITVHKWYKVLSKKE